MNLQSNQPTLRGFPALECQTLWWSNSEARAAAMKTRCDLGALINVSSSVAVLRSCAAHSQERSGVKDMNGETVASIFAPTTTTSRGAYSHAVDVLLLKVCTASDMERVWSLEQTLVDIEQDM